MSRSLERGNPDRKMGESHERVKVSEVGKGERGKEVDGDVMTFGEDTCLSP